jgi:hypothetical protein
VRSDPLGMFVPSVCHTRFDLTGFDSFDVPIASNRTFVIYILEISVTSLLQRAANQDRNKQSGAAVNCIFEFGRIARHYDRVFRIFLQSFKSDARTSIFI